MNNRDLIQKYYDAFNARNYDGMAELLTEKVAHGINEGPVQIGRTEFRAFLDVMDHHYEETVTKLEILTGQSENRMAAEFQIDGVYKVTSEGLPEAIGQKYQLPVGAFFDIENGKISRVTNYYNLSDWISQVSK